MKPRGGNGNSSWNASVSTCTVSGFENVKGKMVIERRTKKSIKKRKETVNDHLESEVLSLPLGSITSANTQQKLLPKETQSKENTAKGVSFRWRLRVWSLR